MYLSRMSLEQMRASRTSRTPTSISSGFVGMPSCFMQFTMSATEEDFYRILAEEAEKDFDPMELLYEKEVPVFEKYDEFVPPELVRKGFAYGVLDVLEMKKRVLHWAAREIKEPGPDALPQPEI